MSTDDRETPTEKPGETGQAHRHEPGGPGDGMRTGGSAGAASGHDPMPDEVDELRRRAQRPARRR